MAEHTEEECTDEELTEEERQQFILEMSRVADQLRDRLATHEPDWGPLHDALPLKHCDGFMYMYRVEWEGAVIEVYKHGITRGWLHLDHDGRAYFYRSPGYIEVPVPVAVDRAFDDIEEMGFTRETPYTREYRDEKHRKARELGWTIIT
jgi:hypothetical protein